MKKVVLLAVLLCSLSSFAGPVVFRENTFLNEELKPLITQAIDQKCPSIRGWVVQEVMTAAFENIVDTLAENVTYVTEFQVQAMDSDNMHPAMPFELEVRSFAEIGRRPKFKVTDVTSADPRHCR